MSAEDPRVCIRTSAASMAARASNVRVDSPKESGVTFTMPMTRHRSPRARVRPPGSEISNGLRRRLFLRNGFVESRNDRRTLFGPRTRLVLVLNPRRRLDWRRLVEREAGGEALDLLGVEHFARE